MELRQLSKELLDRALSMNIPAKQRWLCMSVKRALSKLQSYSDELGLDLTKPEDRFKWFLASVLFARAAIQQKMDLPPFGG